MMTFLLACLALAFLLPALGRMIWWCGAGQRPLWDGIDCSPTDLLPNPKSRPDAGIYILSARTSGLKGALASHSWIVIRKPGSHTYERYDKMGWGEVIWKNGFPADGLWYSNRPVVDLALEGPAAARLIPRLEEAIENYPYAAQGSYCAWPGPNCNSFVAHVLRTAPEIGRMPATAIGRDFRPDSGFGWDGQNCFEMRLRGYLGLAIGLHLIEIHILGLVGGIDLKRRALLVPAIGAVRFVPTRIQVPQLLRKRGEATDYFDSEIA